jgi:LysM repeat protein
MKKLGMVLGAAAVAVVAGCKDPDYTRGTEPAQNEVKNAEPIEVAPAQPSEIKLVDAPQAKRCKCPPGAKHEKPCACGASDCMCIVTPKPVIVATVEPESTIYIVQNGDYLAKISKKFNVTIKSIKTLNNLQKDTIRVGQKLKIPGKVDVGEQKAPVVRKAGPAAAPAAAKKGPYVGATKEYVVKNGDTLGAIAYGNGINIRQLKELNGLKTDVLKVGQKLKIPAEKVEKSSAATKAAPAAKAPTAKTSPAKAPAAKSAPAPKAEAAKPEAAPAAPAAEEPVPAAEPAPAAEPVAASTFPYTVQEGEDITAIVVKFGVSAAEIRELNGLGESDALKAGQIIKLPAEAQQ